MDDQQWLAERFEAHRGRLRAVAYRMLGSPSDAEDAVQEAWLRLSRSDAGGIEDLGAWLTTVVARVCLNALRARDARRERPWDIQRPEPVVTADTESSPERDALLADSVGLALLVVLDMLTPAERLAFVLHDTFAVPFEHIASMIDRSPGAARKLASRARRRIRGHAPTPDGDLAGQREVVDAFFAAAHDGDFDRLVAILHPDVALRAEGGTERPGASTLLRGAHAVAGNARSYARLPLLVRPALVNGAVGVVVMSRDELFSVMGFTVTDGKITAIDVLANPERLRQLDLRVLDRP
jgi:RNA polymerase sigma-70 factor (ECF subfamily)